MSEWDKYFYYRDGKLFNKTHRGRSAKDSEAGSVKAGRYAKVMIKRKAYLSHRVIWEMHNGAIPDGLQVDHINQNKMDNRIENLRLVTNTQNKRNRPLYSNNTSGAVGVSWKKCMNKWVAQISVFGRRKYLGCFDDFKQAELAVTDAKKKYGYHDNHGNAQQLREQAKGE